MSNASRTRISRVSGEVVPVRSPAISLLAELPK